MGSRIPIAAGAAIAVLAGSLLTACSGYVSPEQEEQRYGYIRPSADNVIRVDQTRYRVPCGVPRSMVERCLEAARAYCARQNLALPPFGGNRETRAVSPSLMFGPYTIIQSYYIVETFTFECKAPDPPA